MSIRPIVTRGDPVLRERAREISLEELTSPAVQGLIDDLVDTMRDAGGAGLAANQIGETLRVAVAEVGANHPRYPYKPEIPLTVFVNPVIEPLDDEVTWINEGCLSIPNLRGTLNRYVNVRVRYLDRESREREEVKCGLTAATFQHEVDHLDGVLFLDRVTDPHTFATWEQRNTHQRDAFLAHVEEINHRAVVRGASSVEH
ncbi:MAG: peptide deformylase [Trebonia sp.]